VNAEVLTIGDELLRGEITDSNKSFLSQRLLTLDIETRWHVTCADDRADMTETFRHAAARSDVVLVSGGLGPTRDDLTMEVLAATFGRKLVLHQESLDALRAFFARFGREMAAINEKQAWFPDGAEVLDNPIGTAPGAMLEVPRADGKSSAFFFCMPGVPRELYKMMDEQVLPRIASRLRVTSWARATLLRTFGPGESTLDEMLRDIVAVGADAYTLGGKTIASVADIPLPHEFLNQDLIAQLFPGFGAGLAPFFTGNWAAGSDNVTPVGSLLYDVCVATNATQCTTSFSATVTSMRVNP